MNDIHPKVIGSTVGAGLGSALAVIIVWVLGAVWKITVPQNVIDALGIVLGAAIAFIGGYIMPAFEPKGTNP